jgi:threonine dehydrogenase-like Zn-dependent dehydrogenase
VKKGDFVVMPFAYSDGTCVFCHEGLQTACVHGGFFGFSQEVGGAQAEAVRIPLADGTLYTLPVREDHALAASLLTLSDVMGTGHHAAVTAKVTRGKKVAVVGDGAVGLCGVIAAKRLGAEQIIILGRHAPRIELAKAFGATLRRYEKTGLSDYRSTSVSIEVANILAFTPWLFVCSKTHLSGQFNFRDHVARQSTTAVASLNLL